MRLLLLADWRTYNVMSFLLTASAMRFCIWIYLNTYTGKYFWKYNMVYLNICNNMSLSKSILYNQNSPYCFREEMMLELLRTSSESQFVKDVIPSIFIDQFIFNTAYSFIKSINCTPWLQYTITFQYTLTRLYNNIPNLILNSPTEWWIWLR